MKTQLLASHVISFAHTPVATLFVLHSPADGAVDTSRVSCFLLYSFNMHSIPSPPGSQHTRRCCCDVLPLAYKGQTGPSTSRHRQVSCPECSSNSLAGAVQGAEALPFCQVKVGLQSASYFSTTSALATSPLLTPDLASHLD